MKRALTPTLALFAFLFAAADTGAQEPEDLTLFERFARKVAKNPALGKMTEAPPAGLEKARWLVGTWDVTSRRYATPRLPERVQKGTRKTTFEMKGWWLASIDDIGDLKAASLVTEDPYSQKWARVFLSSWGGGLARPMISSEGWQEGSISFAGAIVLFGEPVEVRLRISKADDDHYFEVWEEKLPDNRVVPIFEIQASRRKAAPATAK